MAEAARLAERFAAAHRESGGRLDYSAESLALVDRLVDAQRRTRGGKAATFATEAGCYLGEVIRRQLGGTWRDTPHSPPRRGLLGLFGSGQPTFSPVLDLGAIVVAPVEKLRTRLHHDAEDTIEAYYEAVERTILPRFEDLAPNRLSLN